MFCVSIFDSKVSTRDKNLFCPFFCSSKTNWNNNFLLKIANNFLLRITEKCHEHGESTRRRSVQSRKKRHLEDDGRQSSTTRMIVSKSARLRTQDLRSASCRATQSMRWWATRSLKFATERVVATRLSRSLRNITSSSMAQSDKRFRIKSSTKLSECSYFYTNSTERTAVYSYTDLIGQFKRCEPWILNADRLARFLISNPLKENESESTWRRLRPHSRFSRSSH